MDDNPTRIPQSKKEAVHFLKNNTNNNNSLNDSAVRLTRNAFERGAAVGQLLSVLKKKIEINTHLRKFFSKLKNNNVEEVNRLIERTPNFTSRIEAAMNIFSFLRRKRDLILNSCFLSLSRFADFHRTQKIIRRIVDDSQGDIREWLFVHHLFNHKRIPTLFTKIGV